MKQMNLNESKFERKKEWMHKRKFLDEIDLMSPWAEQVPHIAHRASELNAKEGLPPFPMEAILRIHFLQKWLNLSDQAMGGTLDGASMPLEFAGLDTRGDILPDEGTILRSGGTPSPRLLLEQNKPRLQILASVAAMVTAKASF